MFFKVVCCRFVVCGKGLNRWSKYENIVSTKLWYEMSLYSRCRQWSLLNLNRQQTSPESPGKSNEKLSLNGCINRFPHTTILQQTTLEIYCQKMESLYNWMDNIWLKEENIVAKGEIARFEQFLRFVTMFSKSRLLQRRQNASIRGNGLTII